MASLAPPLFVEPMLLTSGGELPRGDDWWAELKLDGCRGQLRVTGGAVQLRTRPGRRCDSELPEVTDAAASLPDLVLDGELIVVGADGGPDFAGIRARLGATPRRAASAAAIRPVTFMSFDLLWLDGRDLRSEPLHVRRAHLEALQLNSSRLGTVTSHPGCALEVLEFARQHHLEGVVVKRADSIYRSGRSVAWQRFKNRHSEQVWITAWQPGGQGELDRYWTSRNDGGELTPAGEVSFGLTAAAAARIRRLLTAAEWVPRKRAGMRRVAPVVLLTVEAHGRPNGPLRDPVIRSVETSP